MYPPHLHPCVRAVYWISSCSADLSHFGCLKRFVFLGSGLCLQLPSDSTSRWTPLLLANGWQLPAPIADFHRLVTRHAWRTRRKRRRHDVSSSFLVSSSILHLTYYPFYSRICITSFPLVCFVSIRV